MTDNVGVFARTEAAARKKAVKSTRAWYRRIGSTPPLMRIVSTRVVTSMKPVRGMSCWSVEIEKTR